MGYAIGELTASGGLLAHQNLLLLIQSLAEANGWVTLRYVDSGDNHELILKGEGLSGTEEVFVGFRCYQSAAGDYYNVETASMTGYVPGNIFAAQPGFKSSAVPCHNNVLTYYIICNGQRIAGCVKAGTPVFGHFYQGKLLPYARPGEFPAPLVCGGMLAGAAATRYSDTSYRGPYFGISAGRQFFLRSPVGAWNSASPWPYDNRVAAGASTQVTVLAGAGKLTKTGAVYTPLPIIVVGASGSEGLNVYGELDGVYFCSGFDNGSENVMQVGGTHVIDQAGLSVAQAVSAIRAAGGRALVVLQDVYRTGFVDYCALEMN